MIAKNARTALILAAFTTLSTLPMGASVAFAQASTPREAIINVSGEGQAAIVPDMAILSFSVVKQADTAASALDANSKALAEVLKALKADKIEDKDLQTSNFSIQPLYKQVEPKDGVYVAPEIIGYQVSNGLTVRVRDLAKLGGIIDTSVKLGINQGGDINFTNDKPDATVDEARKAAVANAVEKAKTLAEATGVKLGRVIEINENMPRPMAQPMVRAAMMKEMDAGVPIAAGENTYTVTVNLTFALEQ